MKPRRQLRDLLFCNARASKPLSVFLYDQLTMKLWLAVSKEVDNIIHNLTPPKGF